MASNNKSKLTTSLSPMGAWAFSLGTSVGWGSLVVTSNTYLAKSGPWGSVLGLLIATVIMLVVSHNYAYLIQIYPDAGGAYTYSRDIYGYDHGFLTGWFLTITYLAVLWANATSIPLYARNFLGGIFKIVKMYTIFGYEVYLGETVVTISALVLTVLLCIRFPRGAILAMTGLVCVFAAGISIVFFGAFFLHKGTYAPVFIPDSNALSQVLRIAVISPWAFIGFENISHAAEEYDFERTKINRILVISVFSTTLLYVFVILLSVTAYPDRYGSWLEYIRDLGSLEGLEAFPAFYAAGRYMGSFGVGLLMLSLLALVITSLIGNTMAVSRLFYAMGKDRILPERFGRLDGHNMPANAILLIGIVSLFIPFVGRTAIGWIVDVTTIGATLVYAFVSAAAMKIARKRGDRSEEIAGVIGVVSMAGFGMYNLLPNLLSNGNMESETFFLFILWSIFGFVYFRRILHRDKDRRFGTSIIVWVALLSLVLLIALIWMRQSMLAANDTMMANIEAYYAKGAETTRGADALFMAEQMALLRESNTRTMLMGAFMFFFAIVIMLTNHSYMNKRSVENERMANIDPMTGVKSKHAYLVREKEINEKLEEGEPGEFSVVVCDVNGLKRINDTLGHKAGDEYICAACRMVCEIFSHSPVYRIGGDEFVAILKGRDYLLRSDLMKLLHDRSVANISAGKVVVSGGISDFTPGRDQNFHDVFERADALMYEEKQLLKGMGSISRDEEPVEVEETPEIFSVQKQVLIVEDESVNQLLLGNALRDQYGVLFAADGLEAMEQIRTVKNDLALVLLDLQMPRMGGLEVLRGIKDDPDLRRIPVIVLTADQEAEVECLKIGAMDFIPKPYPAWEIIRARVQKCIELSENRDTIQSTERESLTRLYNFDYFVRYVNMYDHHYWEMAMDAVVIDVNHFHMINERYGRSFGDRVLRQIGEIIRTYAREIGGIGCHRIADTFYLYCPYRKDYSGLLERLTQGFDSLDELTGEPVRNNPDGTEAEAAGSAGPASGLSSEDRVRVRIGVYSNVDKELDIARRFDRAKMAADHIRSGHVEQIGTYDKKMHEEALFRERLLVDFRASIEQERFKVYYQPKFDIRPEKPILSSAEALVRWDHPELGLISPAVFIPLLEDSGRILELDTYVWKKAAAQIREWKDRFGFSVPVSVNVSRIDMLTPNLKDIFREILRDYSLSVDDIVLEITESAYTGDSEQVISTARELRGMGMGFRIEMDDFGTGYSSLGMLTNLPIDALKLDMTFVRSAFGETRDVRMIELIIDIADYLHVPVVAEGVETEEQLLILKALGCDLVQGYYFSKPVPHEEFDAFIIERSRQSVEAVTEIKKTYMSISKALTYDFESIFYVDTLTDYYLEFYAGSDGELQIRPGGSDFFTDAGDKLLEKVCDEDREKVRKAIRKENILNWLGRGDMVPVCYRRREDGGFRPYCLQTIRTRNSDDHHIVIGVRPE